MALFLFISHRWSNNPLWKLVFMFLVWAIMHNVSITLRAQVMFIIQWPVCPSLAEQFIYRMYTQLSRDHRSRSFSTTYETALHVRYQVTHQWTLDEIYQTLDTSKLWPVIPEFNPSITACYMCDYLSHVSGLGYINWH